MEIKIDLNEERFSQLLNDELQKFTSEEIHEILGEAMRKYLENSSNFNDLFVKTHQDSWGYTRTEYTPLMNKIIENIDFSPIFIDIQNKILDYFKNEENIMKGAKEILYNSIVNGLTNALFNSSNFNSELGCEIRKLLYNNKNN